MTSRAQLFAFAPIAAVLLGTGGAAALGLSAESAPSAPLTLRTVLAAEGLRVDTVRRQVCPADLVDACAQPVRQSGSIRLDPVAFDIQQRFGADPESGSSPGSFRFRGTADRELAQVDDCWAPSPPPGPPDRLAGLRVLAALDSGQQASAVDVLTLLGLSRGLWEHFGYDDALRSALDMATLPVDLSLTSAGATVSIDGLEVARAMALTLPVDEVDLAIVHSWRTTWSATALAEAPAIPPAEPLCRG